MVFTIYRTDMIPPRNVGLRLGNAGPTLAQNMSHVSYLLYIHVVIFIL